MADAESATTHVPTQETSEQVVNYKAETNNNIDSKDIPQQNCEDKEEKRPTWVQEREQPQQDKQSPDGDARSPDDSEPHQKIGSVDESTERKHVEMSSDDPQTPASNEDNCTNIGNPEKGLDESGEVQTKANDDDITVEGGASKVIDDPTPVIKVDTTSEQNRLADDVQQQLAAEASDVDKSDGQDATTGETEQQPKKEQSLHEAGEQQAGIEGEDGPDWPAYKSFAETDTTTEGKPAGDDTNHTSEQEEFSKEAEGGTAEVAGTENRPPEDVNYEEKYEAAQRDIAELRATNEELRRRLDISEEEARQRKRLEGSTNTKEVTKVQTDYLARELSQQQDTEKYLREKLTEVLGEKEESERKGRDLQLRLKRFVKDDQAKDERMAKLEAERREISQELQALEEHLDEETLKKIKGTRSPNGTATTSRTNAKKTETPAQQSKTCIII